MDPLLALALVLPFLGKFRKMGTLLAFIIALAFSISQGYYLATFFFTLSIILIVFSSWPQSKYPIFYLAMFDLIGLLRSKTILELFLYFELAIYASYFLITEKRDLRAVFRYFIVNSIGSALMLFAVALSFAETGSLSHLAQKAQIFFVLGLLIKLGIAPFQDWLVEIYRTASLPTILFFSAVLTEISPLALLLVIRKPSPVLQLFALASMSIANIMALSEHNMRRLLALLDASNLAYDLLAIAIASSFSRTAALYMMFSHVLAMCFAFTALIVSKARSIYELHPPKGLEVPFYASFFALSGLPPLHLFPSKILLFLSVFRESSLFSYILLINLALGALVSLRILAAIKHARKIEVEKKYVIFLYFLLAISLLLGLFPNLFFSFVSSQLLFFNRF